MKTLTIELLNGKTFYVDNVGSYFMVTDETMRIANFFSTIESCLDYIKSIA
jgi:hypothetical protein